jgi:SNF2 family DNA or RNA helicase
MHKVVPVGTKNMAEFRSLISPWAIRRTQASIGGTMRLLNRQLLTVELTPEQRRRYLDAKNHYITKAGQRTEVIALAAATHLAQVLTSSWIVDDQAPKDAPKFDAFVDFAKRVAPAKVLTFCKWKRAHELLSEKLTAAGIKHVCYSGELSESERWDAQERFNKDASLQVLVMTEAGQRGLNLQKACNTLVFLDLLHGPAAMRQIIGRVDRHGQPESTINLVYIVADDTSELTIFDKLKTRQSVVDGVFQQNRATMFAEFSPASILAYEKDVPT